MLCDSLSQQPNSSQLNDSKLSSSKLLNESQLTKKKTIKDFEFLPNEKCRLKSSELGKGAYGTVKKVKDIETGKTYAMKIMNKEVLYAYSTKENLKREITIQKKVMHPHIIRLYTFFEDEENVYLVLEFAENGSLFHYLRNKKTFAEKEAFVFFFQTCLGIDYLHKRKIMHRDIKPENLLLDSYGNIKLCDFGWSIDTHDSKQAFCGTVDYMAPEMVKSQPYDHRIDIWSLGIFLYEMLHGRAPFKGKSDREKTQNISANAKFDYDVNLSKEVVDLIQKMLKYNPEDRLTFQEIFNHPWMRKHENVFGMDIKRYVAQNDPMRDIRKNTSPRKNNKENSESPKKLKSPKVQKSENHERRGPYFSPKRNRNPDLLTKMDENSMINEKIIKTDKKQPADNIMQRVDLILSASKVLDVPKLSSDHRARSVAPSNRMLYDSSNKDHRYQHQYGYRTEVKRGNYTDSHSLQYSFQSNKSMSGMACNSIHEESIDQFVHRIYGSNQKPAQFESPYQPYTSPFLAPSISAFNSADQTQFLADLQNMSKNQAEAPHVKDAIQPEKDLSFLEEVLVGFGCISRKDLNKSAKSKKVKKAPF